MATYKLMQDIEAEDKILGPLTLQQFIFALIAVFLFYMCFIMVVNNLVFLLVIFLPPALFFGFFALPFGRDQPTEVWALAKLRFWFKPRRRIWNQSGVKELVTITVPKKVEHVYTNGLSQIEVKSRLKALAETIDSRGWATKHASSGAYEPQTVVSGSADRLIDISSLPQDVPNDDDTPGSDMLDAANNPIARQFDTMINESSRANRERLMSQMNELPLPAAAAPGPASTPVPPGAPDDSSNWFMSQPQAAPTRPEEITATPMPAAAVDPETEATLTASLADRASSRQVSFGNLRTMQPLSDQPAAGAPGPDDFVTYSTSATAAPDDLPLPGDDQAGAMTTPRDPAILSLANNNDLNLATLAREANKNIGGENQSPNEVVVSLH
jgi:hypothetical protein